ncbi:MAG: TIR domain-containing protein [Flavipsychrobacter sp.]|nr:TIR domain-containing protein [Flavipsychrobacter sp.]
MKTIKLFYSYAEKDESFREELEKSLAILKRHDGLHEWYFRKIIPGGDIDENIMVELQESDIILLLLSRDFLASNYCVDVEVAKAIELYSEGKAVVIPIILRECDWQHEKLPFKNMECLPKSALPITKWSDQDAAFNDITQSLKKVILAISTKKSSVEKVLVDNDSDLNESLESLVALFSQEATALNYNSSQGDFDTVQELKRALYNKLVGVLDDKILNVSALKNKVAKSLFESIISLEVLDDLTYQEILKVRGNQRDFSWYDRKIIVNAITLSLLSDRKFAPQKISVLIDFLTDFEDRVWQCALVSLVLALIKHHNKIGRFDNLKKRLETLKNLDDVQEGLKVMELILVHGLFKETISADSIYSNSFFDSPANCFLPFYEDNSVLEESLDNCPENIDGEHFKAAITKLPFLDSFKYFLCLSLPEGNVKEVKDVDLKRNEALKQFIDTMNRQLSISSAFAPYQNLTAEYYNFLTHYSKNKIQDVFKTRTTIVQTKVKSLILSRINELFLTAENLVNNEDYANAIVRLNELLQIEPQNMEALILIAESHANLSNPDYKLALQYLRKIKEDELSFNAFRLMGLCYANLEMYDDALGVLLLAKEISPSNREIILNLSLCYDNLDRNDDEVNILDYGLSLYPNDPEFLVRKGWAYMAKEDYQQAANYGLRALAKQEKKLLSRIYNLLISAYTDLEDNSQALKYSELALGIEKNNLLTLMNVGRMYLVCKIDLELAGKYMYKAYSIQKSKILLGNLGHFELCSGNTDRAIDFYKECVLGFDRFEDFEKRFDIDMKYITNYGIDEAEYLLIKEQMKNYWQSK